MFRYLKRIYLTTFLMFFYAIYLTFYDNLFFTVGMGVLLLIATIIIYLPIVKEIYYTHIKKL